MLDLQAIKDRLGAATSGCWRWSPGLKAPSIDGDEEFLIVSYDWESNDPELVGTARTECSASLIACAPRDLGSLVGEVERLKVENDSQDLHICYLLDEADKLKAEVERLRGAIEAHHATTVLRLGGASPWATDVELWEALA